MEAWESELVGRSSTSCIDGFIDDGRAELVTELLFPFPVNVIAGLLGLPREDLPQFHRWTVELISVGIDMRHGARRVAGAARLPHGLLARAARESRATT